MIRGGDGTPVFYRLDGTCVETAPAMRRADLDATRGGVIAALQVAPGIAIGPYTAMVRGDQRPLDVAWAIDILHGSAIPHSTDGDCVRT